MSDQISSDCKLPIVDVIVIHWRNSTLTNRCLGSIAALNYPCIRVIVVENGSDDESGADVWAYMQQRTHCVSRIACAESDEAGEKTFLHAEGVPLGEARWILVQSHINRGYAGGANLGLRAAQLLGGGTYFWLLNNDLTVDPDAIGALLERTSRDPRIGLCGCFQMGADATGCSTGTVIATGGLAYLPWWGLFWCIQEESESAAECEARVEARMFGVQGAAVFGTHDFLDQVGFLDEERFLYFEEQDWAVRARRAGYVLAYAPAARIFHAAGSSLGHVEAGGRASSVSRYFLARSRIAFTLRVYPYAIPTVCLFQLALIARLLLKGRPRDAFLALAGARDALTGRMRKFRGLGTVSY